MEPLPKNTTSTSLYHKPMRLKGYDYTSSGAYAITILAQSGNSIFYHSQLHHILKTEWARLSDRFPGIVPSTFMAMPDHIHCMLIISAEIHGLYNVSNVIGAYKSIVYKVWRLYVKETGINLPITLWKRRFYDHIVRNDIDFANQTAYILNNPIKAALCNQDCEAFYTPGKHSQ